MATGFCPEVHKFSPHPHTHSLLRTDSIILASSPFPLGRVIENEIDLCSQPKYSLPLKFHHLTGREEPEEKQRYSSTLSLTSTLDGVDG